MAGKALSLIDLFNLYKKNLKAGIYFLILAIISSVFFFFFNNAYLKGEYDYEVKINIKSPLLNLNMVNILGINRLVINEDSSVSYSSVNENIREYYVIVEEYMKLAHNEALKYNDFFSYNTDITNYKNVLLTIQFKSVKDLNTVSSKVDNFVDVLNSSIGELILYNIQFENKYVQSLLSFSESSNAKRENHLKLIKMREYLKGTFEQENFKVFEIQSKKKTSKDLQLDKVIIIIFLLFFILYSLFIVAFR